MTTLAVLPVAVDINVTRGTDNTLEFTFTNAAGTAENLTGDTVKFTARDGYGATVKIATKTNTTHTDPTAGKTRFTLSQADLTEAGADVTRPIVWYYEVRRLVGGSTPAIVWFQGLLNLYPAVTPQ